MNLDYIEIARLITRTRDGDDAAVEELVRAHHPTVYQLALSILDDPAEADEAAQDALIKAIERLNTFRGESSFKTWLYSIALNECRGRLRKQRARERLSRTLHALFRLDLGTPLTESIVMGNETDAAVWHAIRALPDQLREPIVLRYFHELRIADIAQVLGVTDRTVRSRLQAANERLRNELKGKVELP